MYEMTNQIPFTQSGADGCLKLHHAVTMMMDCCQFQEYQETKFREFLTERGLAIFLFSFQIDIFRLPAFRETVKTAVRIYGCQSIYGLRRISMRDESGKLCLLSNATGAFFDLKALRAAKLNPEELPIVFDPAEPMECLPRKIPVPREGGSILPPYPVHSSDLDPNGHLTSPVYFAIAQNSLPEKFPFNRVRVEYKSQVKLEESVTPVLFDAGDGKMVVNMLGSSDGRSAAVAEFSTADLSAEQQG